MAALTFPWLDGTLVSSSALQHTLDACALGRHEEAIARAVRRLHVAHRRAMLRLGPASGSSAVWLHAAAPAAAVLGWRVHAPAVIPLGGVPAYVGLLEADAARQTLLAALPWGVVTGGVVRPLCRAGLARGVSRVMLTNGRLWLCRDVQRPLGRQHAALDLDAAATDQRVWEALWLLAGSGRDRLETMAALTRTLEAGATQAIREAVAAVRPRLATLLRAPDAEVLTHVFRWLFLLFAEARSLVPVDNPIYRRAYAIATLAADARGGRAPLGLWEGLQATARLAHTGCRHPLLRVTALNGTLFDPGYTPRASRLAPADAAIAPLLDALTSRQTRTGRSGIVFGDLGVEHLGTIYEDVLASGGARTAAAGTERKRTGTYYTPRDLADHLVAETLAPLVDGRSADQILALRIVDPAAGSGAILAAAARYLRAALEAAWVRDGRAGALDVTDNERRDAVRCIVEQCLYGVDAHGRAIQVARLSLWLASMTRDRPLTFLDHHLRVGNSLVGAWPIDIAVRPPRAAGAGTTPPDQLRLFDLDAWDRQATQLARAFARLSERPSDTAEAVRAKTRSFRVLHDSAALARWRRRADAWCAALMRQPSLTAGVWQEIDAHLAGRATTAPSRAIRQLLGELEGQAREVDCFHWPLEFPEVFHGAGRDGFDAVLANPPWEMLRTDGGTDAERSDLRRRRGGQLRFVAGSGGYSRGGAAHRNLYQLFVERMLALCRPGGRLGIVAPWGLLGDEGSAATRQRLLEKAALDGVTVFENRRGIFPIHRSVRFVTVTATTGRESGGVPLRPAVDAVEDTQAGGRADTAVWLGADVWHAAGGRARALPYLRSDADLTVLQQVVRGGVCLGEPPWSLGFGRELNATDDRTAIAARRSPRGSLPVIGGRQLRPFGLERDPRTDPALPRIREDEARARLRRRTWQRWRLAYRDVASPGNRWALIAALVPPGVVTTHTVFTVRDPPRLRRQVYLCAVLNSLVANWFVRLYLGTHVTSALMARLPVPLPAEAGAARRIARAGLRLRRLGGEALLSDAVFAGLQAEVGRLYGLSAAQMAVVLDGTPQLPAASRAAILAAGWAGHGGDTSAGRP